MYVLINIYAYMYITAFREKKEAIDLKKYKKKNIKKEREERLYYL